MSEGRAQASPHVLVLTRSNDFHAFAIADALSRRGLASAIVETDRVAGRGGVSWYLGGGHEPATLQDVDGRRVVVEDVSVVWWRRLTGEPELPDEVEPEARDFVARECRAALLGLVASEFTGRYVSDPEATRAASNKLVQLRAAERAGFRVPRTIVSSDLPAVRDFCDSLGWKVVAKTVGGAGPRQPVMTGIVLPELLQDAAVRMCPAIYQELIPGDQHLRVNVFGRAVHAAQLRSSRLDWRYPLDCEVAPTEIDEVTTGRLFDVLDALGLRMGIFDLKVTPEGEVVWLEVNPQGQFLWLEGMADMKLGDAFAEFLAAEVALGRPAESGSSDIR